MRITFFGGGTDYPEYYLRHKGRTIGAAIDKYTYVVLRNLAEIDPYRYRLIYAKSELCNAISEIQQPVIRETLREAEDDQPTEIHYFADLPGFSGLGTSSSFTVGLLNALFARRGTHLSRQELAERAVHVERHRLNEMVGVQDQFTCAHGGLVRLDMDSQGVRRSEVPLPRERLNQLNSCLMMFFTGTNRYAQHVLGEQMEKTKGGTLDSALSDLAALVDDGVAILQGSGDLMAFGEMLDHAWRIKRHLSSSITNSHLDDIYRAARAAGAIGGKLMGAGAGGFFLFFVPPHAGARVVEALKPIIHVPFALDESGTTVMNLVPHPGGERSEASATTRQLRAI
jgi:D-glycero-alpha-D-manno-heptose-7-phosphate kinase